MKGCSRRDQIITKSIVNIELLCKCLGSRYYFCSVLFYFFLQERIEFKRFNSNDIGRGWRRRSGDARTPPVEKTLERHNDRIPFLIFSVICLSSFYTLAPTVCSVLYLRGTSSTLALLYSTSTKRACWAQIHWRSQFPLYAELSVICWLRTGKQPK